MKETQLLWDFSRLEDLQVPLHILGHMAQSMSLSSFSRLHRLKVEHVWVGIDMDDYIMYHDTRTQFLNSVMHHVPANQIEEIDLKCHLPSLSIHALSRHGHSLQVLHLLDASGFEVDGTVTPTTSITDLEILRSTCPNLKVATLGINVQSADVSEARLSALHL